MAFFPNINTQENTDCPWSLFKSVDFWAPYDPTTSYELGYVNKHTSSLVQELRHIARLCSATVRLNDYMAH